VCSTGLIRLLDLEQLLLLQRQQFDFNPQEMATSMWALQKQLSCLDNICPTISIYRLSRLHTRSHNNGVNRCWWRVIANISHIKNIEIQLQCTVCRRSGTYRAAGIGSSRGAMTACRYCGGHNVSSSFRPLWTLTCAIDDGSGECLVEIKGDDVLRLLGLPVQRQADSPVGVDVNDSSLNIDEMMRMFDPAHSLVECAERAAFQFGFVTIRCNDWVDYNSNNNNNNRTVAGRSNNTSMDPTSIGVWTDDQRVCLDQESQDSQSMLIQNNGSHNQRNTAGTGGQFLNQKQIHSRLNAYFVSHLRASRPHQEVMTGGHYAFVCRVLRSSVSYSSSSSSASAPNAIPTTIRFQEINRARPWQLNNNVSMCVPMQPHMVLEAIECTKYDAISNVADGWHLLQKLQKKVHHMS
jgi:hypothetical protein